jgi:transposase-like protein
MCRVFDGALRKKIIESAKANSVPEAARLFDVTTDQIRGWIDAEDNRKKS